MFLTAQNAHQPWSGTANTCDKQREDSYQVFYRGDSLARARISLAEGFAAAGIGEAPGNLGRGLYMSRQPEVAGIWAGMALRDFGNYAIIRIVIATWIWNFLVYVFPPPDGIQDNVPLFGPAVPLFQTFVPSGLALFMFDFASSKEIVQSGSEPRL